MLNTWLFRLVVVCVLAFPAGATRAAMQTGPLIADLVGYQDVRAVIPGDTAATFARAVEADADQLAAATALVDGARTELGRIVNRHLRAVRDDPTLKQIEDSELEVVRLAKAVERQLLVDLAGVLRPDQEARLSDFERAHRRSLLKLAKPQPMPVDLWTFFAANGFDPATNESVSGTLEAFDRASDAALVRQRRALNAYFDNLRLGFDGTDESQKRNRIAQNEFLAANANLERVHAAVVEPMIDALPPELADKLVMRIIELSTRDYDKNVSDPERYPIVREILALDLSPEQRQSVRGIVDGANAEALALARASVIDQARYLLLPDELRTDGRTSPLNLYLGKASELRKRVSGSALALLTPQQRLAYDASDVVDPSKSSVVNDD